MIVIVPVSSSGPGRSLCMSSGRSRFLTWEMFFYSRPPPVGVGGNAHRFFTNESERVACSRPAEHACRHRSDSSLVLHVSKAYIDMSEPSVKNLRHDMTPTHASSSLLPLRLSALAPFFCLDCLSSRTTSSRKSLPAKDCLRLQQRRSRSQIGDGVYG